MQKPLQLHNFSILEVWELKKTVLHWTQTRTEKSPLDGLFQFTRFLIFFIIELNQVYVAIFTVYIVSQLTKYFSGTE